MAPARSHNHSSSSTFLHLHHCCAKGKRTKNRLPDILSPSLCVLVSPGQRFAVAGPSARFETAARHARLRSAPQPICPLPCLPSPAQSRRPIHRFCSLSPPLRPPLSSQAHLTLKTIQQQSLVTLSSVCATSTAIVRYRRSTPPPVAPRPCPSALVSAGFAPCPPGRPLVLVLLASRLFVPAAPVVTARYHCRDNGGLHPEGYAAAQPPSSPRSPD